MELRVPQDQRRSGDRLGGGGGDEGAQTGPQEPDPLHPGAGDQCPTGLDGIGHHGVELEQLDAALTVAVATVVEPLHGDAGGGEVPRLDHLQPVDVDQLAVDRRAHHEAGLRGAGGQMHGAEHLGTSPK